MIVSLDSFKLALGLATDVTDNNDALTALLTRASVWVENETHRRFTDPAPRTEYVRGNGGDTLFFPGHLVVPDTEPAIVVSERVIFGNWETLTINDDYELRENTIVRVGSFWLPQAEYRLVYLDGFAEGDAPDDIQGVVLELAIGEYQANIGAADGQSNLLSEDLVGVYSYSLLKKERNFAGAGGGGTLSDVGAATIKRYQRKFV